MTKSWKRSCEGVDATLMQWEPKDTGNHKEKEGII